MLVADGHGDGKVEDGLDAAHLLAAALHVRGAHAPRDGSPLLGRHGRQPLRLEQVDARALRAQVRLEADKDDGRRGAEVQHFGVPLRIIQRQRS